MRKREDSHLLSANELFIAHARCALADFDFLRVRLEGSEYLPCCDDGVLSSAPVTFEDGSRASPISLSLSLSCVLSLSPPRSHRVTGTREEAS